MKKKKMTNGLRMSISIKFAHPGDSVGPGAQWLLVMKVNSREPGTKVTKNLGLVRPWSGDGNSFYTVKNRYYIKSKP